MSNNLTTEQVETINPWQPNISPCLTVGSWNNRTRGCTPDSPDCGQVKMANFYEHGN